MTQLIKRNEAVAKKKGWLATAALGGSVAALVLASSPVLGILGLAGSAYLGWDWLEFRKKHGLRI